ncbi:MAG TPA: GntR family transcriptional regulator, partial [Telluria sp.]|nr:GntR family transcriptional regulator [Telluria sp.]
MLKRASSGQDVQAPEHRMYRVVADRIEALIRDEQILPGLRLPSERELATRLQVSRASLREALIALELGGVVEVRGGSGVYVSEARVEAPAVEVGPGPFEVLAARRLIEAEVCAIAARVATDGAIDAILEAVLAMERNHDIYSSNELADREFHLAIARATGNSALVGTIAYLWDQRGRLWHRLKERFQTEQLRQETLKDHRRILA